MSSVQLPKGAEPSHLGGIKTNAPLAAVLSVALAYLASLLTLVPAIGGGSTEIVVVNGILSGIAVALLVPATWPGHKGRLTANHCEPYASYLRVFTYVCVGVTIVLLFRHFAYPFPAFFLVAPTLFSGIGGHHLQQIRTVLRTAEWKEKQEDKQGK